jgi:hypothetical protein
MAYVCTSENMVKQSSRLFLSCACPGSHEQPQISTRSGRRSPMANHSGV